MTSGLVVVLACAASCCACHAPSSSDGELPLHSSSVLEVRSTRAFVSPERGEIRLDELVVRTRGDARLLEASLVVFSDVDADGEADDSEWIVTTVVRPKEGAPVRWRTLSFERRPRLTAELKVVSEPPDPAVIRWSLDPGPASVGR